ncbi:hypothetical protein CYMTET_24871 [Cymbomonas tetramitiformis]|uniref:Uncharacterized protein n=1 Tax=Cymbomonas tetramitiformis TaxID=36881 RepID=A0AAE0KZG7_9CHLO|nr:hypothetical protein CYMTET_24871 [Cymbomonas tetramitiformis]
MSCKVGRPATHNLAFPGGNLELKLVDASYIEAYVQNRDYVVEPRGFFSFPLDEEDAEIWLDDDSWEDLYQIATALSQLRILKGNKAKTVAKVKVRSQNSPWLHLTEVYDRDEDSKRLKWRWWRPLSGGFTSKNTRTMTQASVHDPGFSLGRIPVLSPEFILFDPQEILVAWDVEEGDEDGQIPKDMYIELVQKLRVIMRENKRTK